eukprot:TRINITY_DN41501_c0_g1_i1.p1 TRINITY_DN41501_c0_g1~~TRINITY_DN41501_c0_g1_i1.p1  ORF type:complete len:250 (-),score=38.57 TRINITY_DN41501_c0_g1_i1:95-844(-)
MAISFRKDCRISLFAALAIWMSAATIVLSQHCQQPPPSNANDIPEGAYQDTCNGCKLEANGAKLSCSHCMKADRSRVTATLELRPGTCKLEEGHKIRNVDGDLVCEPPLPENGPNLPRGSYLTSCFGCNVRFGKLICSDCYDAVKRRAPSSAALQNCRSFSNTDGRLICDDVTESVVTGARTQDGNLKVLECGSEPSLSPSEAKPIKDRLYAKDSEYKQSLDKIGDILAQAQAFVQQESNNKKAPSTEL